MSLQSLTSPENGISCLMNLETCMTKYLSVIILMQSGPLAAYYKLPLNRVVVVIFFYLLSVLFLFSI